MARSHNGAVCLVEDGRVVVAVQLERLERRKRHQLEVGDGRAGDGVRRAVNYCLRHAGIGFDDVDHVAVSTPSPLPVDLTWPYGQLHWIPHHLAHAEYVVHFSDVQPGVVLVVDGHGTWERDRARLAVHEEVVDGARVVPGESETISAYRFDGTDLALIYRMNGVPDRDTGRVGASIGSMWEAASELIFGVGDQAGKVMGLAALGSSDRLPMVLDWDGDLLVTRPERLLRSRLPFRDVAAGLQQQTSRAALTLAVDLARRESATHLYLSGGVALNVTTNEVLVRSGVFDQVHMNGSCEDNGTAIGAALALEHQVTGRRIPEPVTEFLGRAHPIALVMAQLRDLPVRCRRLHLDEVVEHVSTRLAAGAVVGWFQGRSEFGPRALGHRSILADPRSAAMREVVNGLVKRREPFRPLAAAVLQDRAADHFDLDGASPVMMRSVPVTDPGLPAVTHTDGTCRVQTVDGNQPELCALLHAFGELTGTPVLLNTSLNGPGEPIAESPLDAALTALRTGLDLLVVGDLVVEPC